MAMHTPTTLPQDLLEQLEQAFFIRFTTTGRRSRQARTTETTFVWDALPSGVGRIYVSGYPGRRDWVANVQAHPSVTLHTVEYGVYYDILAHGRVILIPSDRTKPLLSFLHRWANRPESKQKVFGWLVAAIEINQRLRLPWWGPFYLVRRILDRMPCVEFTFVGEPIRRNTPPPACSSGH